MAIYFLRRGDLIKIGFSDDVRTRVTQLKSSAPPGEITFLGYMPGDRSMEKHLHKKFSEYRSYGEWFRSHSALLMLIEAACDTELPSKTADRAKPRIGEIDEQMAEVTAEFINAYIGASGRGAEEALRNVAVSFGLSADRLNEIFIGDARAVTCGEFALCLSLASASGKTHHGPYADLIGEFGAPLYAEEEGR